MANRSVRTLATRTVLVAGCVLAIGAAAPSAVATVEPTEPSVAPRIWIAPAQATGVYGLTVEGESEQQRTVVLHCRPDGGSHPAPSEACAQLAAAEGRPDQIPPVGMVCTAEYAPVTVIAIGSWQGQDRDYRRTFPNRCEALRQTGGVLFNF